MYSVTKRIDFCYGHRLLEYDGVCKHPHGHNAVAEIEVTNRAARQPQHGLRLQRHQADRQGLDRSRDRSQDDPAAGTIRSWRRSATLGEPMFLVDSNPTVEHIARIIFDYASSQQLPVVRVTVWETPTSFAEYRAADLTAACSISSSSISTGRWWTRARDLAQSANAVLAAVRVRAARRGSHRPDGRGRRRHARRACVRGLGMPAASGRAGADSCRLQRPPARERRARTTASRNCWQRSTAASRSPCSPTSRLRPTLEILDGLDLSRHFSRELIVGGDGPFPRKPDPSALRDLAQRVGTDRPAAR